MGLYWGVIITLVFFCMKRVLMLDYREQRHRSFLANPYDRQETAEGIRQALEMSDEEQNQRMSRMRSVVQQNNIYYWAGKILNELPRISMAV